MKQLTKFKKLQQIDLMEFVVRMNEVKEGIDIFKKGKHASILNIDLPDSFVNDTIKGVLIYKRKATNLSQDVLDVIKKVEEIN